MSLPRCFGVFGDPVAHSRSPAMHNAAFAWAGLAGGEEEDNEGEEEGEERGADPATADASDASHASIRSRSRATSAHGSDAVGGGGGCCMVELALFGGGEV